MSAGILTRICLEPLDSYRGAAPTSPRRLRLVGKPVATWGDNGVPVIVAVRRLWGEHYRLELPPLY
jgi:hypothetical protein